MGLQVARGRLLQRDGGLGLHVLAHRQAQQARHGIEPAPGRRGLRAVQPACQHGLHGTRRRVAHHGREARHDLLGLAAGVQQGRRHAPRLTRGHVTTRQGQGPQVAHALAARAVHPQQFASPGSAIQPQAHAIEREGDDGLLHTVLGQHRRRVGMVVLHRHGGHATLPGQAQRQAGAEEVRVQVVRHGVQRRAGARQQVLHRLLQRRAGGRVGQVAMHGGPQRRLGRLGIEQAGAVFQEGPAGQDACHGADLLNPALL